MLILPPQKKNRKLAKNLQKSDEPEVTQEVYYLGMNEKKMAMSQISFCALVLLACFSSIAMFSDEIEPYQDGKRHSRVSARHIEAGGIGYSQGYTTLEGFFAPDPQQWLLMPFLDLRGHVFNNGKIAANAGLGFRGISGCRTYGLNAYYDYRNTKRLHYNQVSVGLETLGTLWDFRINGYWPVGRKITSPYNVKFGSFSGHYLLLSQKRQFAMKGGDAEIGFHFGKIQNFDFYAAAGPYYFIGEIGPNTWGGKARLAGMYKEYITVGVSNSYDRMFHNHFQGQLTFTLPFGGRSRVKKTDACNSCIMADAIVSRMVQPIEREEIIVVGKGNQSPTAIDPATGNPYFFLFVNNMSHSDGTYESPYPTLVQAQDNSSPNDIIYVFPGDGTTTGMDSGIALKANQMFWGSGVSHSIQTSEGTISIPAQTGSSPTITNTNINTDGNAITLATHNSISGFNITSARNDAIFGTDPQSLEVSSCTIKNTTTYAIEAIFSGNTSISLTNNQFLNNVNGVILTLNGTSTVVCSDNTFDSQTSSSSIPVEISANSNVFTANIQNNVFSNNATGSIRFDLNTVVDANITLSNNSITNNGTGSVGVELGSSFVILPTGTTDNCFITSSGNLFSGNASHSLYLDPSGAFTTLAFTASTNTMSNNGGSALVIATPADTLTLLATDNMITECDDNGIAVISSTAVTTTGTITINNNTITNIGNNGIAINQDFSNLDLTILNNEINICDGTGIVSFPPTDIDSWALNISDNTIGNCQNNGGNAASGISLDNYLNLTATMTNNTFSDNVSPSVALGLFSSGNPAICLTLTGNSCNVDPSYSLTNPGSGAFNLSPCDVDSANIGMITTSGVITPVQSCPDATPCPP